LSNTYSYQQYFGLSENPFSITPDPRFVYLSDSHRRALEHLEHGAAAAGSGFVLLTGDIGSGKTTICRTFLERLSPKTEVVLILNPVLTLNEFLQAICDDLDLAIEGSRESNKNLIDHLNRFLLQVYAVGHKTILVVDEAQNLTHDLLEQIRLLTNLESNTDKLLQIFLIGQPELRDILKRPELLQVGQRITSRYHLVPLGKAETREYIRRRLAVAGGEGIEFTTGAIGRIHGVSKGVPRLINVLCDRALMTAYRQSTRKIDSRVVREAEQQVLGAPGPSRGSPGRWVSALGMLVLAAALGLGVAYWGDVGGVRPWLGDRLAALQDRAGGALTQAPPSPASRPAPAGTTASRAMPVQVATPPSAPPFAPQLPTVASAEPSDAPAPLPKPSPDAAIGAAPTQAETGAAGEGAAMQPVASVDAENPGAPRREEAAAQAPDAARGAMPAAAQDSAMTNTEPAATAAVPAPGAPAPSSSDASRGLAAADYPAPPPDTAAADESLIDYTRRYAERKLLSIWGIAEAEPTGLDFCRNVSGFGLQCLSESSGLAGLNRYDRPAILFLTIGDVSSYAVLVKASPSQVVLDVLDREHVIPADALADVWNGSFLLLWRKPSGVEGNLGLGAAGQPVVWLRRAIDRIEGVTTSGNVFDEQLFDRVKQFQRDVGLTPDGIVGPRTLILLQNKLATSSG
jgi:general secretion pathway protein A